MFAKFSTWLRPAPTTPLQRRLDHLWMEGVMIGLFSGLAGLAGIAVISVSSLSGPSLPALALLVFSCVGIVVLTWRSLRIRNQLADRLALLDAE